MIANSPESKTLQTPRGSLAFAFVQEGTLLLYGQSLEYRKLSASDEKLSIGNPKTSARGCLAIQKIIPTFHEKPKFFGSG